MNVFSYLVLQVCSERVFQCFFNSGFSSTEMEGKEADISASPMKKGNFPFQVNSEHLATGL
jgi:hypothetical protein